MASEVAKPKSKILPRLYLIWATIAILLTFLADKFSNDNITHFVILIILGLSLVIFKFLKVKNPKNFFILSSVTLAALVEGAYMITKPVLPSLLVDQTTTPAQFVSNYGLDLLLTLPLYYVIFLMVWWLINKYHYSRWEYIFLIALGQALGDGSAFFIAQPTALMFLPYVMINYHAMNIAPFLAIQKFLPDTPKSDSRWKYLVTVSILIAIYFLGGSVINVIAQTMSLI